MARAGRGLATAGLADEAERFARLDVEGDAVDGLALGDLALEHEAGGDREVDLRSFDVDERLADRADPSGVLRS